MVDYFLKIDTVPGDSRDAHRPGAIEVVAFSWGETKAEATERAAFENFHFTTLTGTASPKLMLLCANGRHVAGATLVGRRADATQQEYFTLTFNDVSVSSYHVSASAGDSPLDEVSLAFSRVHIAF